MTYRTPTALLAALVLFTSAAFAQKPEPRSPLEIGHDPVESVERVAPDRLVAADGTPRALFHVDYALRPAAPAEMARQYLAENAAALRLASPDLADLTVRHVRTSLAGHNVRFRQTVDGVRVYAPETVVNIDRDHRVQLVLNEVRPALSIATTTPTLSGEEARRIAFAHLDVRGTLHHEEIELVVYPTETGARLAWRVFVTPAEPAGDWESFVDAGTGELFRVARRTLFHGHDRSERAPRPIVEAMSSGQQPMRVDATGFIHDPDPLTRADATYGDPGFTDGNDANTPQLEAARREVTLRDVTFDGSVYKLEGPYADILDWDPPFKGEFDQPEPEWSFTRDHDAFEAATVYWHIDNYMRYANETLGIEVMPHQYPTGVRFDPSGWNGGDNSSYSSGSGRLTFGEGGVDDAEDADVIIHELGHGLHDWLTVGGLSNGDGLSEGLGDYFAVSYSRSLGLIDPEDPEYNWVFKWDGHNQFWPGRVTNLGTTYPSGSAPHARGQHWSTSLMRIWDDLGGSRTDRAVMEGIAMTNSGTTQPIAAQAVLQAALSMLYSQDELQMMVDHFNTQGYNVDLPHPQPVANEDGATADGYSLTAAYPNPFSPSRPAALTLRVEEAQHVTATLFDVLGRSVRTLHDGALSAGAEQTLTVEAGGLPSGLYVVRVAGERFAATRTLTLVR